MLTMMSGLLSVFNKYQLLLIRLYWCKSQPGRRIWKRFANTSMEGIRYYDLPCFLLL